MVRGSESEDGVKILRTLMFGLLVVAGCGDSGAGGTGGDTGGESGGESGEPEGACATNTVVLGRYRDDQCTPGTEVGTVTLVLAESCGSWSRDTPVGTKDDSFTRYQCYADRFCFTVHPGSISCEAGADDADVELKAGVCQQDKPVDGAPEIKNYTKVISGLEGCPAAPEGYSCPSSAVGEGTPGVAVCSG